MVVISGKQEYLRQREVGRALTGARLTGRRIIEVGEEDEAGLLGALSGGFLFTETSLVLIESGLRPTKAPKKSKKPAEDTESTWEKTVISLLLEHTKEGSNEIAILLHHTDDVVPASMVGKIVTSIPKDRHAAFPAPKMWDAQKYAIGFFQQELKRLGKTMPDPLVEAVIQQVGTELGLLSFDALKISTLLDWEGRTEVTKADLVGILTTFGAADWDSLRDALGLRDARRVSQSISRLRNGAAGDMFGKASAYVSRAVIQWLYAASLREAGISDEEASNQVGLHLYPYRKDVLPPAVRWGRKALADLLRAVTKVAVRKGHASPWVALESVLVLACVTR